MRKRKNKKQVRIIVGLSICLLLMMTVGYAAFSTNLTITAKGNIKDYNAAWQLKKKVVNSGDGLYVDSYEDGRYIYKGTNPNNYIEFSGEVWRIIAIEADDNLKIIKNSPIGYYYFDNKDARTEGYCNSETTLGNGCNCWATNNNFISGNFSGIVNLDSTLKTQLNINYYETLPQKAKEIIVLNSFKYGPVDNKQNTTLKETLAQEKAYTAKSYIGLLNVSDYVKANINNECSTVYEFSLTGHSCVTSNITDNWIHNLGYSWTWTMNAYSSSNNIIWFINAASSAGVRDGILDYGNYSGTSSNSVNPVVHLKSDIKLLGSGTETDPYTIK